MTNAPGPFVTIRPGGPLNAVVTIAANRKAGLLVAAEWKLNGEHRSASVALPSYAAARKLAHEWADLLVAGREPEPA